MDKLAEENPADSVPLIKIYDRIAYLKNTFFKPRKIKTNSQK